MRTVAVAFAVLIAVGAQARAEDVEPSDKVVVVDLTDGSRVIGRVVAEDDEHLRIRTRAGAEVDVPRRAIAALQAAGEATVRPPRLDPNYSRLMFGPTGRPLAKGDGYFSDYEIFFPGVAVGVTDHLSLAGGVSAFPGLGLDNQAFYVSPRLAYQFSERFSAGVGGLYATIDADDDDYYDSGRESLGIGFAVATYGDRRRSVTAGLGVLRAGDETTPIVMIGGTATLSRNIALVSENWLILDQDFEIGHQPLGAAVRFFGERLSADVGLVVVPAYVDEAAFVPWLSVSYHFGPTRAESRGRASAAMPPPLRRR